MHDGRRGLKKKKKKREDRTRRCAPRSRVIQSVFPLFPLSFFLNGLKYYVTIEKKKEKKKMVNVSPHSLVCRDALTLPDNTHAPLRNRRGGRDEDEANGGGGGMKGEGAEGRQRESSSGPSPLFFFSFFRG